MTTPLRPVALVVGPWKDATPEDHARMDEVLRTLVDRGWAPVFYPRAFLQPGGNEDWGGTRPGANVVDLLRPWLEAGVRADPGPLLAAIGELRAQAPAEWHQQIDYDVQRAGQDAQALSEVRLRLAMSLDGLHVGSRSGPLTGEPAPAAPPVEAPSKPPRKPIGAPVAAGGGA